MLRSQLAMRGQRTTGRQIAPPDVCGQRVYQTRNRRTHGELSLGQFIDRPILGGQTPDRKKISGGCQGADDWHLSDTEDPSGMRAKFNRKAWPFALAAVPSTVMLIETFKAWLDPSITLAPLHALILCR